MKQVPAIVGWLLIIITLSVYCYGIYYAIFHSNISEQLDTLITTIGAILLTNFGAVLGISITDQTSGLASTTLINKKFKDIPPPLTKREIIQLISVAIYIISILACFITWICKANDTYYQLVIEPNAKTFLGVVTAYLAFVLGVSRA